ncbi:MULTISPECIES: hypothetical protein [Stenotrophomonas maltophilia group]|uniref:hypothetical protein n=1 Tax=Stenotrophomonas maltophilia group TaxID=995085 RepID=UPI00053B56C8|nr:hypothetical protein [Stenotrophomonas maltophilia]ASE52240.1 hypothetical protein CEQ03_05415 [Stenotrophomonas maltophilia]KOO74822.1 hypothetical protein VK66_20430 [Stenotrophomonas maltophilia]MBH1421320.1 hypothetical protein [Stenotrophomonas maltophilia]MBH1782439.1 hypothetical protein [Stenotrophomonas maltophilia]MBN5053521.1 hypothetical protein [Stenotrophomonas maltophilia]
MGILDFLGSAAGVVTMQTGADVFIHRHTRVVTFNLPSHWRDHANKLVKERFQQQLVQSEFDAALLKLAVFWTCAMQSDRVRAEHFADAMFDLRTAAGGQITPGLSLEVMRLTNH